MIINLFMMGFSENSKLALVAGFLFILRYQKAPKRTKSANFGAAKNVCSNVPQFFW